LPPTGTRSEPDWPCESSRSRPAATQWPSPKPSGSPSTFSPKAKRRRPPRARPCRCDGPRCARPLGVPDLSRRSRRRRRHRGPASASKELGTVGDQPDALYWLIRPDCEAANDPCATLDVCTMPLSAPSTEQRWHRSTSGRAEGFLELVVADDAAYVAANYPNTDLWKVPLGGARALPRSPPTWGASLTHRRRRLALRRHRAHGLPRGEVRSSNGRPTAWKACPPIFIQARSAVSSVDLCVGKGRRRNRWEPLGWGSTNSTRVPNQG
jgi:hypothetical protein